MIRLPNKLYSFNETVLADFVKILHTVGDTPVSVAELNKQLSASVPTENLIDALSLLLTLGSLELDQEKGVVSRAH